MITFPLKIKGGKGFMEFLTVLTIIGSFFFKVHNSLKNQRMDFCSGNLWNTKLYESFHKYSMKESWNDILKYLNKKKVFTKLYIYKTTNCQKRKHLKNFHGDSTLFIIIKFLSGFLLFLLYAFSWHFNKSLFFVSFNIGKDWN